jgi:hypothetical protein
LSLSLVEKSGSDPGISLRYDNWCTWTFVVKNYWILLKVLKDYGFWIPLWYLQTFFRNVCSRGSSQILINMSFYVYIIPKRNKYNCFNSNLKKEEENYHRLKFENWITKMLIRRKKLLNPFESSQRLRLLNTSLVSSNVL